MESKRLDLKGKRFPIACHWEITYRCNLNCAMCYTNSRNTPEQISEELSTAEIFRILDELTQAGCLELTLTGGEPLARPDFLEIYQRAASKGFLITLFTNATLLDKRALDAFKSYPPYLIEISLHGVTPSTFESVTRKKDSFAKCMSAIKELHKNHFNLLLKATATTLNKAEVLAVKNYAQTLEDVRFILGEELRESLDSAQNLLRFQLSNEELDKIEAADPDITREVCNSTTAPVGSCLAGKHFFHLDAYGALQLCSLHRKESYDLRKGNLLEGFYQHLPAFSCPLKETDSHTRSVPEACDV
ncbi:MAG: radical SAM protein [Candidatus Omnitrophica bacterium]|nr:radical SAM protein [Candidatus Omnitrophota bacterium]